VRRTVGAVGIASALVTFMCDLCTLRSQIYTINVHFYTLHRRLGQLRTLKYKLSVACRVECIELLYELVTLPAVDPSERAGT
jgi:hypothetical protein